MKIDIKRLFIVFTLMSLVGCAHTDWIKERFGWGTEEPEVKTSVEVHEIDNGESGLISFETHGITHQRGRNGDGGWEFFFFDAKGKNIGKCILYHCGGGGRQGRVYYKGVDPFYNTKKLAAFTDNLPGWHEWVIEWGEGVMDVRLDGKSVKGCPSPFFGKIEKVWIGGCRDSRRNFKGSWRNLKVKGKVI